MNDVKITVIESKCSRMRVGDYFIVKGDKVHAPMKQGICFYSLSTLTAFFAPWEMEKGSTDHYILNFTKISCPMNNVIYLAERIKDIPLDSDQGIELQLQEETDD